MRKLMVFAVPFAAGPLLCQYILPEAARGWMVAAALAAGLGLSRLLAGRERLVVSIAGCGLAAGLAWYAGYAALYLEPAEALTGTEAAVTLELTDYAETTAYGARCTVLVLDPALRGQAMYYGSPDLLELEPGNQVTATAAFDSARAVGGEESAYYLSRGVFLRLYGRGEETAAPGAAGSIRYLPQRLAQKLRSTAAVIYAVPARGFLIALLTGERDSLDRRSDTDLREAGLMHITAVSGLHCGFLIAFLGLLALRRQRLTALLGYPVLVVYVLAVGCTPSAVRACVMVGLALLAPLAGRENDGLTSLSAALLVILLANPFAIGSVSLQLSFAATTGLLLVSPRVYIALHARRPRLGRAAGKAWSFFQSTLSASVGVMALTTPLSAAYFGTVSLASPLANLLVLWMAPVLFAGAMTVTALSALWPAFGALSFFPELLARYVLWVAGLLAKIPGHSLHVDRPGGTLWLAFVYVLLAVCLLSRGGKRVYLLAAASAVVCLAAVRALPGLAVRDDVLTAVAVNVGQGAATLLHSGDVTILTDCGSLDAGGAPGAAVADVMETYGWEKLDDVILTHYHTDHAGGLEELLNLVKADRLLLPQLAEDENQGDLQREVLALAARYGTEVYYVEAPLETAMGAAVLTVYPPLTGGDMNERGLTVLCTAGQFDLLITGDMNRRTERLLVETYTLPDIEVLLAGHHGSRYSTSEELLEAVRPEVGIISVGENSYGHPTQEAMDRMALAGMTLYRTDIQGTILIQVHGEDKESLEESVWQ